MVTGGGVVEWLCCLWFNCFSLDGFWFKSHCVQNFIAYFWAPYTKSPPRFRGFLWVFMGFHGFSEVVITSNLGGPVGVVGGLGEVCSTSVPTLWALQSQLFGHVKMDTVHSSAIEFGTIENSLTAKCCRWSIKKSSDWELFSPHKHIPMQISLVIAPPVQRGFAIPGVVWKISLEVPTKLLKFSLSDDIISFLLWTCTYMLLEYFLFAIHEKPVVPHQFFGNPCPMLLFPTPGVCSPPSLRIPCAGCISVKS